MSDCEHIPTRRVIEPFVYFPTHASAIKGLGGPERSPDPNYCFHTHYFEYRAGQVDVHITLLSARANVGELSVRIHGYRPEHPGLGIKLIAAERVDLARLGGGDHHILVRFHAIPGVHYAAYGHFSESSDLVAMGVDLVVEELGGDDVGNYHEGAAPPTMLDPADITSVNALVSSRAASLDFPTSQACTPVQLLSPLMGNVVPGLMCDNELDQWKAVFAAQALQSYGLLQSGATGLIVGDLPAPLAGHIQGRGCRLDLAVDRGAEDVAPLLPKSLGHFDFALCLDSALHASRYGGIAQLIDTILQHLFSGGWAVIMFDLVPAGGQLVPSCPDAVEVADVKRWALRLIGHGCSIAQLNFPSRSENFANGPAPFGLIICRQ